MAMGLTPPHQPLPPFPSFRADSPFFQQRLKAWQPILTPGYLILSFIVIGAPFIGVGSYLMAVDSDVRAVV